MLIAVDIDGTLATETHGDYSSCRPFTRRINRIKRLYRAGHTIWIFTARGGGHRSLTEAQLKVWGVPYHRLIMDKPKADKFVDDKGINADDFFADTLSSRP
jgi:carbamoyl-phosphate synthase large subunit